MKRMTIAVLLILLLSGCAVSGGTLTEFEGKKELLKHASDTLVYHEAYSYQNNRMNEAYSVLVEQTTGPLMTLICENGTINKIIVYEEGYTEWIQIFDDRILCLTGDDGDVKAELMSNLSSLGDFETIVQCVKDPVSLAEGRKFQKVSGEEEGSLQIATDNIDFWMKVSADKKMDQIRLYFSDLPMMTLTYSNELPLFPNVEIQDYPAYFDVLSITEERLIELGYEQMEEIFVQHHEDFTEEIVLSDLRMDYALKSEKHTIRLVYDNLTLMGIHTDNETHDYCEVVLIGNRDITDDIRCPRELEKECLDVFEQIQNEFK